METSVHPDALAIGERQVKSLVRGWRKCGWILIFSLEHFTWNICYRVHKIPSIYFKLVLRFSNNLCWRVTNQNVTKITVISIVLPLPCIQCFVMLGRGCGFVVKQQVLCAMASKSNDKGTPVKTQDQACQFDSSLLEGTFSCRDICVVDYC